MSKRVIIVGAGIAGLTAAIYAQRSGFAATLIEQHQIVGGMCTSWRRKGYLFEGGVHWLTGSNPNVAVYQIWKDTGALNDTVPISYRDPFLSIEYEGQLIHLYRNIDKTAAQLLSISPEDKPLITSLVKDVKKLTTMSMPIFDIKGVKTADPKSMGLGFLLGMLPALSTMNRLNKLSCQEYVERFKHPGLQRLLGFLPGRYNASSLIFTLATFHAGDGGYPEGGSLAMVNRMSRTFTDLGGTLLLNTRVREVVIEDGVATGVVLEHVAQEHEALDADAVIVTQETIAALAQLFDPPLQDAKLNALRVTTKPSACTFVCVGVSTKLPEDVLPEWELPEPITYADQVVNRLSFNSYSGFTDYAPAGGTALTTLFVADTYDYWKASREAGHYEADKQALAEQVSRAFCEKYPQVEGRIEVIDVATPLTYERYTSAYHGSWMSITEPGDKMNQLEGTVEGVQSLFFAGHRLMSPGGLPSAAASGRTAAQLVCRQFDVQFR